MGVERPSGRRYFQIARGLAAQGHRVRLLALHPDMASCERRRYVEDGVEVWYVGQMHARKAGTVPERFGPLALLLVLARSTLGMIWGVICSPAEAYHLGKPQPVNGLAALVAVALLRRRPFFVDCDDDEVKGNRLTAGWQRAVFAFWQGLLPRLAAGVTVNTEHLAAEVARAGARNIVLVPNGVELTRFTAPPVAQLAALRVSLGLDGRRVVAYAGTLALQNHPVDLLVEAFVAVAAARPEAVLLLIGGGEDLPALRALAGQRGLGDRVYFTGQLPHRAVAAFLALAELSVDPVRDDDVARARSPLKLFESMALGVPVVTGAVGDRPTLLADGAAGVLVPPGNPAALAAAILALLDDEPRRLALAKAGRAHACGYDWPLLARTWAAVYEPLMGREA
jgi:glycosyltransferase involved in cell wall biosynthesis